MAENSQSQKAGECSTLIQAVGDVTLIQGVSYADLDRKISEARREIAQDVLSRAQEMLRDAGIKPKSVPIKTVVPLLQYSSMEEDNDLRAMWAALLANAASTGVHPSFPGILSKLSRNDAVFLDKITDHAIAVAENQFKKPTPDNEHVQSVNLRSELELIGLYADAGLTRNSRAILTTMNDGTHPGFMEDQRSFRLSLNTLLREELIWRKQLTRPQNQLFNTYLNFGCFTTSNEYFITSLGFEFISACRKPAGRTVE